MTEAGTTAPVVISVSELAASDPRPVVLDVRWALGDPHGYSHYLDAHLPAAVFVDMETELAEPPSPQAGRHPLPDLADLEQSARRWGIRAGDAVVVYDATGGTAAARAWWLLRWGGIADVRILDGGLPAWVAAGYPVETGSAAEVSAGDVVLAGNGMPTIDIETAAGWQGALLDARARERYRGEVEPVDPRAGHIPGALSVPTSENLDSAGYFKSQTELSERFAGLAGPVAVYCGSGITAAHEIAALAVAGIDAALFPGSWSQWSADESRPAATGAQP